MKFLNTEMYMVTFAIIVIEMVMLCFQVIYYLQRTSDKRRLLFLILLVFLLLYNICSGLFPDPKIPIPVTVQTVIAFLVGFTMSMYFVYYFYKAFELKSLKWFTTWGSLWFLLLPFLLTFVWPYAMYGDLETARRNGVIVPFIYGLTFIGFTTKAFLKKMKTERNLKELLVAAYIALLCWATLPVIVYFGDYQVLEHSVTNAGFLMMTLIYIRQSIREAREEYERLQQGVTDIWARVDANCHRYKLTAREAEVAKEIIKGQPYKLIANTLKISERTVSKHTEKISDKVGVSNRVEMTHKLQGHDRDAAQ